GFGRKVEEITKLGDASIGDGHRKASVSLYRRFDHLLYEADVGSVANHARAACASSLYFLGRGRYKICVDVVKDHGCAPLTQLPAYFPPDPGSCAGDDGNIILKR